MPSSNNEISRVDLDAWLVSTLRLTVFPSPGAQFSLEPDWWTVLIGQPPEDRILKPRMGGLQAEGPFESGRLRLIIQPGRIDWLYLASADPEHSDNPFPVIGRFSPASELFFSKMFKWLPTSPVSHRLAFGAILNLPVSDRSLGYRQLSPYLPAVTVDAVGSTDLIYQINRSRNSEALPSLCINRLSKWSVMKGQITEIDMTAEPPLPVAGQVSYACHLELDINTVPEPPHDLFPEKLPLIFQELGALGKEIVMQGDIP